MAESSVPTINFKESALGLLPDGSNFEACLTCGLCSSGCPASGIENMDPRKFIRMAMLGMNEELSTTPWIWCCTLCKRCQYVCPMSIDVSQLVFLARGNWPEDRKPTGIVRSCQLAQATGSTSAMGMPPADFVSVVDEVLQEVRSTQPGFARLQAPTLPTKARKQAASSIRRDTGIATLRPVIWRSTKTPDASDTARKYPAAM